MEKIIGGKRYNTETAQHVGQHRADYSVTDFNYYTEDLYLKKTGEFFIHGVGNAASKYCESFGENTQRGSEKIVPITIKEAKEWVVKYLEPDDYEKLFEVEEENSYTFSINFPISLYEKLKDISQVEDRTIKDVIIEALNEYYGFDK